VREIIRGCADGVPWCGVWLAPLLGPGYPWSRKPLFKALQLLGYKAGLPSVLCVLYKGSCICPDHG
jgi:hypothetical protein